jgi:hypothetical protein
MKILKIGLLGFVSLLLLTTGCQPQSDTKTNDNKGSAHLVADTIFYPVRIKNIDPDDEWADNRLKNLNRAKLVDGIFNAVYAGKAIAYNYLTDVAYSIDEIKEMEQRDDFSRNNIVELEFREKWWYNTDHSVFSKEVLSVLVAYAVFEDDGTLRSLKAAFYIKPNH